MAAALAVLLLLLLACPATGLQELLRRSASPAEGSSLMVADMSGPQLTALAGTIESMSTELARVGGGTLSAQDIPTMVMETLVAGATGGPTPDVSMVLTPLDGPALTGPTATSSPGPSPTPSLTPTKTKTPTPGPSPTPSNTPTKTLTPTLGPSPTPSHTPTDTPTATLGPSPTSTRTPTPTQTGMPSATFSPSASPSPSATTPVVPTTVAAPTNAATVAVPTVPILPSPTPDVCSQLDLGSFEWIDGSQEVSIEITNNSSVTVKIVGLRLEWPPPNVELKKIELDGRKIWNDGDGSPPTIVTGSWTGSNSDRNIGPDSSKTLVFFFGGSALPGPYALDLWFDASSCHLFRGP